jgi:glycosyltransferase involved in cell wall biosynthesis
MYAQLSLIAFLSEATRRKFERAYPGLDAELLTVEHGNQDLFKLLRRPGEARRRFGLAPDAQVVLFFGGVRPSKGLEDLVEAMTLLPDGSDAILLVVGHPAKQMRLDRLRERIAELGLADRTILHLRYADPGEVAGLMEFATVVVLPYRSAAQSGVLQIAYSFGRPVVATAVGGLAEAVEDESSGLLVPPCDPPRLAAALARILADPALARRLGDRGAELSRTRHAWSGIAAKLITAYRGTSGGSPCPTAPHVPS